MNWMRITFAGLAIGVIVGGYLLWTRVDWASYRPAEPPSETGALDTSLLTIRRIRFDRFDALAETPELTWAQDVEVELEAECVPDRFRIYDPSQPMGAAEMKQPGKLKSSIILDVVRRSSLGDGSKRASVTASSATVDASNSMFWSGHIRVPHVAGMYRVRVILATIYRDALQQTHRDRSLVGAFDLKVIPGRIEGDDS